MKKCGNCKKFLKCFTDSTNFLDKIFDDKEYEECKEIPPCKEYVINNE